MSIVELKEYDLEDITRTLNRNGRDVWHFPFELTEDVLNGIYEIIAACFRKPLENDMKFARLFKVRLYYRLVLVGFVQSDGQC